MKEWMDGKEGRWMDRMTERTLHGRGCIDRQMDDWMNRKMGGKAE